MPFDGIGFAFDDRVSKIDQVISLLDTRDKWYKGNFKTPDGRHCIRGAIKAAEGAEVLQPIVLRAIHEATGQRFMRIESFNDHPYTRHAQVLRVLAHARHLLTSQRSTEEPAPQVSAPARWHFRLQAWIKGLSRTN
jgi:hypothetical protein